MRVKIDINNGEASLTFDYPGQIESFPDIVEYQGLLYEWAAYGSSKDLTIDYELNYISLDPTDYRRKARHQDLEVMAGLKSKSTCDCGGTKLGHPGHSSWCSDFKKEVV